MRNGSRNQIKQKRTNEAAVEAENVRRESKTRRQAKFDVTSSAHEAKLMQPGDEKLQLAAVAAAAGSLDHTHTHTGMQTLPRSPSRTRVFSTLTQALSLSLSVAVALSVGAQANSKRKVLTKTTTSRREQCIPRDCVLYAVVVSWPRCPQLSARCERN